MLDGTPAEVFSHVRELEAASLAAPQVTYLMTELREGISGIRMCHYDRAGKGRNKKVMLKDITLGQY